MLSALELYKSDMPKLKLTKRVLYKNLLNIKVRENKGDEDVLKLLRIIEKNLQNNNKTIITKILYYLWNGIDFVSKTREEIVLECEIKDFNHYTKWTGSKGRYKLLIEENNLWKINHEIKESVQCLMKKFSC